MADGLAGNLLGQFSLAQTPGGQRILAQSDLLQQQQAQQQQQQLARLQQQQQLQQQAEALRGFGFPGIAGGVEVGLPLDQLAKLREAQGVQQRADQRQELQQQLFGGGVAGVGGGADSGLMAGDRGTATALLLDPATAPLGQSLLTDIRAQEQQQRQIEREQRSEAVQERAVSRKARQDKEVRLLKAREQLPQVEQTAQMSLDLLNKLENHPGFSGSVGAKGSSFGFGAFDSPISGTDEAGFMALFDQVKGRSFLEAFGQLKGGGSITEKESEKATSAVNRLSLATSEEEFVDALSDLRTVVNAGVTRARRQAGVKGPAMTSAGLSQDKVDEVVASSTLKDLIAVAKKRGLKLE